MKIRLLVLSLFSIFGVSACGGSGSTLGSSTSSNTTATNDQITQVVSTATNSGNTIGLTNTLDATVTTGAGAGSNTSSASAGNAVLSAEGLWQGRADTSRVVTTLIADSSFYWMLYSSAGSSTNIAGVVVGNSLSSNGQITSNNGKDFNFETGALLPLTWTGTYTAKSSLQASLTYTDIPGGVVALNAVHDSNYNLTPSFAKISGTYSGTSVSLVNGRQDTTIIIYSAGQINGSRIDGCTFTGTISPFVRGNAYNVSIDYGVNCRERNSGRSNNSKGSAYLNPANNQLTSVSLNSSIDDVLLFIGNKR
ncbi:hypothetical protein RCF98_06525 [Thiothrix lacustris]|uniref:Uncharacterized protein n=1 Tax=Thiothrix lacustris TaxID=525917 RepID=A0ABY9MTJ4_9GAMM|nr:hypothetical protein [Thiothrix lacustris]WML91991.1 hypothetical protein RCF98_06525 [Thiothrix lacustris]